MTKFIFPNDKPLDLNFKSKFKELAIDDELNTIGSYTKSTNYNITQIIKNHLNFMSDSNLLPYLPSKIKIIYVNENSKFFNSLSEKIRGKYSYPASMVPEKAILYISKDFELDSKTLLLRQSKKQQEQYIIDLRNCFNQDNTKALEYVFGHELGHFFLLIQNSKKSLLTDNIYLRTIARHIEEGFSESFSLQLMYIQNPSLNTLKIENYRRNDTLFRFDFITNNKLSKPEMIAHFDKIGYDKLLHTYHFKTIYKDLPILKNDGSIENDINVIYDKCYLLSLKNNKEVITEIINDKTYEDYGLSIKLYEKIYALAPKEENKDDISKIINSVHDKFNNIGFSTKIIKTLREDSLHSTNTIKLKK